MKMILDFEAEIRVDSDEDAPHIKGHAAVFNKPVQIYRDMKEQVAPGAFANSIKTDDIRAFKNHNSDYVLGRKSAGTLTLEEDKRGLAADIMPPDTQWARDYMLSIKRGDVTGMSFGFNVLREEWDEKKELRTLLEVKLVEVSPVAMPAYPQTDVSVRAVFESAGIDYELLSEAIAKNTRGIGTESDKDIIKRSIEKLQLMTAETRDGAGEAEGAEPQAIHSVDVLRRQLELISIK